MFGETQKPILPHPRSAEYKRERKKQFPISSNKRLLWRRIRNILVLQFGVALCLLIPITLSAQTYMVLHHFTGLDGSAPQGGLVLSGATLYGTTYGQYLPYANSGVGTVFKINTDGTGFAVLKYFAWWDGANPLAGLALSGSTLYGTTVNGGGGSRGTVFRIGSDGSGFAVLKSFDGNDGAYPSARLVLSGSTLYGTTYEGPPSHSGTVFKVNTDGSDFGLLHAFTATGGGGSADTNSDGAWPQSGLTLSGTTLYGAAFGGGTRAYGTVFKVNTNGSGFGVLKQFNGGDEGSHPCAELVMSNAVLYGTTSWIGESSESNYGTVFAVNTDGTGFLTLKRFTNWLSDGMLPQDLLLSRKTLYGTTEFGVTSGYEGDGTVFRINTDGSEFTVLKNFTGTDGGGPGSGLLLSGSTLYGTASSGGISNAGVVFALGFPPTIFRNPRTQTAEAGSSVQLSVRVTYPSETLNCQWFLNDTNIVSGATRPLLQLTNVQPSQSGAYTVVVTNVFGAVTSAPAMLSVIAPVPRSTVPAVSFTGDFGSVLHLSSGDTLGPGAAWQELDAVTLTTTPQFYPDLTLPLPSSRFYRAWQTNVPSVQPALQMSFATAFTLTGAIGSNLRVDYINQFGPTDAWVTLDTVTLTNATQPYFDFTMFRQPARLYRLVPVP